MNTTISKMLVCLTLTGAAAAMAGEDRMKDERASAQQTQYGASQTLSGMAIDAIEGKDIVDSTGQQVGDVDEVVNNKSQQRMLVVGLKGSTKEVAVPIDEFSVSADGKNLTTRMSRAEMLTLPDYDPMDMESADE